METSRSIDEPQSVPFDVWRNLCSELPPPHAVEAPDIDAFGARVQYASRPGLDALVCDLTQQALRRRKAEIHQRTPACQGLTVILDGSADVIVGSRTQRLGAGDIFAYPSHRPVEWEIGERTVFLTLATYLDYIPPLAGHIWEQDQLTLHRSDPIAGLLAANLRVIAGSIERLDEAAVALAARQVTDLAALRLVGGRAIEEDAQGALRSARLTRIKQVIAQLAHQPDLRVEMVAAAGGVSVRQLYRLFDLAGESYAEHLAIQRVAAVKKVVAESLGQSRTFTDIAHACGFNDLSTFNRTFRRLQGLTPSEYRADLMVRELRSGS